jgi:transcription initiation factor IIE alpha subunit
VLAKKYGVRKNRIQEEIVELRKQGHAICASEKGDCRGYFIPLTYSESIDYMRATESRAKNIFNNLRAMHKALNDLFPCGQTTIDGII